MNKHDPIRDPGSAAVPSTSGEQESAAREQLRAGIACSMQGDIAAALARFREAAVLAPGWGLPYFLAGSEAAAAGDFAAAEAQFASAVLHDPALLLARYQLGLLQFSGGRAALAMLTWQPLLSAQDAGPLADCVRGFGALAADAFDACRGHFEAALAAPGLNPGVAADLRKVLAQIAVGQGPPETPTAPAEWAGAGHFLLSGYGGSGPLH